MVHSADFSSSQPPSGSRIVVSRALSFISVVFVVVFLVFSLRTRGVVPIDTLRTAFDVPFQVREIDDAMYSELLWTGSSAARARLMDIFAQRFKRNEPLVMSWMGSSVTYQGFMLPPLEEHLRRSFPGVVVKNFGIPATGPQYHTYCIADLMGDELYRTDIFVMEFSVTDYGDDVMGESYEAMVSTLLQLPQRPSVVLYLHSSPPTIVSAFKDRRRLRNDQNNMRWGMGESDQHRTHWAIGEKYGAPIVRLGPLMDPLAPAELKLYFRDVIHPNEEGGRLIAQLFMRLFATIVAGPALPGFPARKRPPPLPLADRQCRTVVGTEMSLIPTEIGAGWRFINDTTTYAVGKGGWQSEADGATITFPLRNCSRKVMVYFLSSYELDMGSVEATVPGCTAAPQVISGLWPVQRQITTGKALQLTEGCAATEIKLTARAQAGTGGTRFKLIAIACE